jgi:hypothetical protein
MALFEGAYERNVIGTMDTRHKLVRPILMWLVLFGSISAFFFWNNTILAIRLTRNHRTAEGTVIQLLPMNHRTVVASYAVNANQFSTATSLPEQLGLPPFEQLRVGDKVDVEYNPSQPDQATLGSAQKLFVSNIEDTAGIGIFLLFCVALIEFRIRSRLAMRSIPQSEMARGHRK